MNAADGQELHEADQAEVERAAGERVHLPGHRDAQHLVAEAAQVRALQYSTNGRWRRMVAGTASGSLLIGGDWLAAAAAGPFAPNRRIAHGLWRGGAEGARTPDLLIANEALSQLSYGPATAPRTAAFRREFTGGGIYGVRFHAVKDAGPAARRAGTSH